MLFRSQFYSRVAAPVTGFDPLAWNLTEKELDLLDPTTQFALAASWMAIRDAGLSAKVTNPKRGFQEIQEADPDRIATILGTGIGGLSTIATSHEIWVRNPKGERPKAKRYSLPMLIPNAVPAQVAIKYQARGECKAVTTACAAGTMAIGDAFRLLRDGEADMAIAGGAECALSTPDGYGFIGFDLLRTMSSRNHEPAKASRPFDKERDGFVLSEGAGIVILERLEHAKARGARIYAEVGGYVANCEAYHMIMLDPEIRRITRLMEQIFRATGVRPEEVDYINAHGTSTPINDRTETMAIRSAFGSHADNLLVSSTKSMTGHAIGASGGIEVIATALALHTGIVPPTINLEVPDPECDLNYVPNRSVTREIRVALSNSYGFGGHNASLLLRKYPS